jgi:hypothetical protein
MNLERHKSTATPVGGTMFYIFLRKTRFTFKIDFSRMCCKPQKLRGKFCLFLLQIMDKGLFSTVSCAKKKSLPDFMSYLDSLSFKLVSDAQKSGIYALLYRLPESMPGLGIILEHAHVPLSRRTCGLSEATEIYSLTEIHLSGYE